MLEIPGLKGIKKILWKDISPGMVIVGGLKINNGFPLELVQFPTLTPGLVRDLTEKYKLLPNREVVVAEAVRGQSANKMATAIRTIEKRLYSVNGFRKNLFVERQKLISDLKLEVAPEEFIMQTSAVDRDFLIKDTYNSFEIKLLKENVPSIFNRMEEAITLADVMSGRLKDKFNLPEDKEVLLHLVIDYSYSMDTMDKMKRVIATVHSFYRMLSEFMLNLKIQVYAFSDICVPVNIPLSGKEIERKDTNYSSFMKKILHHNNKDVYNKVILFTDGEPSDLEEALINGNRMKKQKIDYTQIIFSINDDKRLRLKGDTSKIKLIDGFAVDKGNLESYTLSDEEWSKEKLMIHEQFTRVAEACGGNQLILNIYDLLNMVSFEVYDRYMGMLTLANTPSVEAAVREISREADFKPEEPEKKVIKNFQFKKIDRK